MSLFKESMKVIITYGKNHEVGTWMMALGKNPSRWLLSAFPSLGQWMWMPWFQHRHTLLASNCLKCKFCVCSDRRWFFGHCQISVTIHSVAMVGSHYDGRSECTTRSNTTLWYLSCFVAKEKEPPAFQTLWSCSYWCTHTHVQTCSALWMLNLT